MLAEEDGQRWERGGKLAFGANDSSWVVVFTFALLCDLVEFLSSCEEIVLCYVGFESFGAYERFRVIVADRNLRVGVDKRLLDG